MAVSWEKQIGREAQWWFSHEKPHFAIQTHIDFFRYIYKLYFSSVHDKSFNYALEIGPGGSGGYLPLIRNIKKRFAVEPVADQLREKGFLPYSQRIKYTNCYAEDMPYGEDTFDLIVISNALDHVKDVGKTMDEMYRVLKKGGYVMFFTFLDVKIPHPTTFKTPAEVDELFGKYECQEGHFIKSIGVLERVRSDYYAAVYKK